MVDAADEVFKPLPPHARWCNGSTADFGSACHGSNPCRAATNSPEQTPFEFYYFSLRAFRTLLKQRSGVFASWHSQMRTTVQPDWRKRRVVLRSRILFCLILSRHAFTLVFGVTFLPQLWPCQKHPSTNTATLALGHMKSGRPANGWCLRQPDNLAFRSSEARRSSVVSFPLLRTRDINCPRVRPPKVVCSF